MPTLVVVEGRWWRPLIGLGFNVGSPSQDDLNTVIDLINTSESRVNKLGTAYEFNFNYQYRFSGEMFVW